MSLKNVVLGIAIIILTIFVTIYGISVFYERPEYDDFCSDARIPKLERDAGVCPAVCVEMYEIQDGECSFNSCGSGCGPDGLNSFDTLKQCEIGLSGQNCYDLYDDANKEYSKTVFIIALILGIVIIAIGAFLFNLEAVGAGLMGGGVGTILYGVGGYWRYSGDVLRFVLSLIGLILVIAFAYWLNRKNKKGLKGFFRKIGFN